MKERNKDKEDKKEERQQMKEKANGINERKEEGEKICSLKRIR